MFSWKYVYFDFMIDSQLTILIQRELIKTEKFIIKLCNSTINAKWHMHIRMKFFRR
jgi:hypothetical protein